MSVRLGAMAAGVYHLQVAQIVSQRYQALEMAWATYLKVLVPSRALLRRPNGVAGARHEESLRDWVEHAQTTTSLARWKRTAGRLQMGWTVRASVEGLGLVLDSSSGPLCLRESPRRRTGEP